MAKRIKIDFTKTEERSGWNTRQIPEGLYLAKVTGVQETEAQDGTAMLVYAFVPEDKHFKSRKFPYYCKLQQNQLWKLRDLLVAAGETVPKRAVNIDPDKIVGKLVAIEVEDDSYNGTVRSAVTGVYAPEILGDEEGDTTSDEEDEELDEELPESYDELDDEDEDDEDLLEDDEEELFEDDEEDYDDDDDDDEEEPELVTKRRSTPARKATPAKRTVTRR